MEAAPPWPHALGPGSRRLPAGHRGVLLAAAPRPAGLAMRPTPFKPQPAGGMVPLRSVLCNPPEDCTPRDFCEPPHSRRSIRPPWPLKRLGP